MTWPIIVVEPALSWLHRLRRTDRKTLILVSQAIEALSIEGPVLGRPWSTRSRALRCPT
jgi:hypothetical protein